MTGCPPGWDWSLQNIPPLLHCQTPGCGTNAQKNHNTGINKNIKWTFLLSITDGFSRRSRQRENRPSVTLSVCLDSNTVRSRQAKSRLDGEIIIHHFYFITVELLTRATNYIQFIESNLSKKKHAGINTGREKKAERWMNLLHVEDLHWIPLLLFYSTDRSGAAEQRRRAPSKRWGWRRRVEERGMPPWIEKLWGRQGENTRKEEI